jgi:benzoate-CoA ligase
MLPGYRDPRSYMPNGKYPDEWPAFERIHSPKWRAWQPPPMDEWLNPTELLLDRNLRRGETAEKVAVIADDVFYTYRQISQMVGRAASAIAGKLGLDYDNRILIIAPDRIEAAATWLGAHRAGVVPCWVSPLYMAQDILYFLEDLACKALFIDATVLPKLEEIRDRLPATLKHIVVYRADPTNPGDIPYDALVADAADEFPPFKKHIDDISYLYYSSGTTGRAKCVVHTARDFAWLPQTFLDFMDWKPDDLHYDTSPKFHTHGLWPGLLMPLWNGATAILRSERLSPELVVRTLEQYKPQILTTVPLVVKWLIAYPSEQARRPDLSSLKMVHCASEKIPPVIQQRFLELYDLEVYDSIGSSEVTYEWLANNHEEHKSGTCGKPIFGCEAMLVDPQTLEIVKEPRRNGELWVKSDSVFFFYWRKYHKSRSSLAGGWTRTGDLMYFDEDGFFTHVGRTDDVFKVSGMWVSPLEIEGALLKHPRVKDAAVVPYNDAQTSLTCPKAYVVLAAGERLTDELTAELQELVRREAGGYKVPQAIEQIDEIPKTALQKVSRSSLRQLTLRQQSKS